MTHDCEGLGEKRCQDDYKKGKKKFDQPALRELESMTQPFPGPAFDCGAGVLTTPLEV